MIIEEVILLYHYVYEIVYTTGKKYIGCRTSDVLPSNDTSYIGSSKHTPNDKVKEKIILGTFLTRELALEYECYLHNKLNVHLSKDYYNQAVQTSTKFSTQGLTKENCDWMRQAAENKKKYYGEFRTEKQKAGSIQAIKTATGQKVPSRGRKGAESNRFKPWYLISPKGEYREFLDITISDFLLTNHNTPFNRASIFHATINYEHIKIPRGKARDWIIGFLPKPISNYVCYPIANYSWWYKPPGQPKIYVFGMSRRYFCSLNLVQNLTPQRIKQGILTGEPIKKGKFKDWQFGLITGVK